MNENEAKIERALHALGLNSPNAIDIDDAIVKEQYHIFDGTTVTVCCLTLRNGACVTGVSAAMSSEDFDPEIGKLMAEKSAHDKIWDLEDYLIKQKLYEKMPGW